MTSLMTLNQHKIKNYIIIASLKSESVGIHREYQIPSFDIKFTRLALRTHAELLGKPRNVNKRSQSLAW